MRVLLVKWNWDRLGAGAGQEGRQRGAFGVLPPAPPGVPPGRPGLPAPSAGCGAPVVLHQISPRRPISLFPSSPIPADYTASKRQKQEQHAAFWARRLSLSQLCSDLKA